MLALVCCTPHLQVFGILSVIVQ